MNSQIGVRGDVDVVMDQNYGAVTINNFYNDTKVTPAVPPELRRAVGELLAVCDPCNQRKLIEKISHRAFGTTDFKSLKLDQVQWLSEIAKDVSSSIVKSQINISDYIEKKTPWWKFW